MLVFGPLEPYFDNGGYMTICFIMFVIEILILFGGFLVSKLLGFKINGKFREPVLLLGVVPILFASSLVWPVVIFLGEMIFWCMLLCVSVASIRFLSDPDSWTNVKKRQRELSTQIINDNEVTDEIVDEYLKLRNIDV